MENIEEMEEFIKGGFKETLIMRREELEWVLEKVEISFREELKMGVTRTVECAWLNIPSINGARMPTLKKCLQKFNEALANIDNGTYGICATCEKQIPLRRLALVPFATQCASCKEETKICLSID